MVDESGMMKSTSGILKSINLADQLPDSLLKKDY